MKDQNNKQEQMTSVLSFSYIFGYFNSVVLVWFAIYVKYLKQVFFSQFNEVEYPNWLNEIKISIQ